MSSFDPRRIPAWLAPGLRREIRLPLRQAVRVVRQPARHRRGVAVAHRAEQHRQREPVDLEEDQPWNVAAVDDALPARDALRDPHRVRVVRTEEHREHDAHGGDDERSEKRPAEVVDREHPVGDVGDDEEDQGVRDQHEQEAEDERERQPKSCEHGRDDRVQGRDDRRHEQRTQEALDVDAGQDPCGHHQGDARGEPRDEQREEPKPGRSGRHTEWP